VRVSLLAEHTGLAGVRHVRALTPVDGLVGRLEAVAARPGARLRSHRPPTPAQETILALVDPQSLPFDPEPDSLKEPMEQRRGRPSLWRRVTARVRRSGAS